jgi:hypothetical protein
MGLPEYIEKFANLLQQRVEDYYKKYTAEHNAWDKKQGGEGNVDYHIHKQSWQVKVKPGVKYTKINVGDSGKFMVDNETGGLYFIKGYGVIDKKKYFGTVENLLKNTNKWWYDGYSISPIGKRGAYGYAGQITEARLSARGRREIGRVYKQVDTPDDELTIWSKNTLAFMSDGKILQKRDVIFKPDKYNPKGKRHSWGWKSYGKVKPGVTPEEAFGKFVADMEKKGWVKEGLNEEPIYGTTGPLPLPMGATKPVIQPNTDDKKKLLIIKLKNLIRDEVRKALLYDTDRPGEIKTRTKDFQKIDIQNDSIEKEGMRSDIENTARFEIYYDESPNTVSLDKKIKLLAKKLQFQINDSFLTNDPGGYAYVVDILADPKDFGKIGKVFDKLALQTGGNT